MDSRKLLVNVGICVLTLRATASYGSSGTSAYNPVEFTDKNIPQICVNEKLKPERLIQWYYYQGGKNIVVAKEFHSPSNLQNAIGERKRNSESGKKGSIIRAIISVTGSVIFEKHSAFAANFGSSKEKSGKRYDQIARFLSGRYAGLVVKCVPPATNVPPPTNVSPVTKNLPRGNGLNFLLRKTPNDFSIPRAGKGYSTVPGFTFSFNDNGVNKNTSGALEGAFGYGIHLGNIANQKIFFIPYVAIDRNIARNDGVISSSSRENFAAGFQADLRSKVPLGIIGERKSFGTNIAAFSFERLWNNIDHAQQNIFKFSDTPIINGWVNDFACIRCPFEQHASGKATRWIEPIFRIAADVGHYVRRGDPSSSKYSINRDYFQVGAKFGFELLFDSIKSDIRVTDLYMYNLDRTRKNISHFSVNFTYHPFQGSNQKNVFLKNVGLHFGYDNGNIETTAQRINQLLVSVSLKY